MNQYKLMKHRSALTGSLNQKMSVTMLTQQASHLSQCKFHQCMSPYNKLLCEHAARFARRIGSAMDTWSITIIIRMKRCCQHSCRWGKKNKQTNKFLLQCCKVILFTWCYLCSHGLQGYIGRVKSFRKLVFMSCLARWPQSEHCPLVPWFLLPCW